MKWTTPICLLAASLWIGCNTANAETSPEKTQTVWLDELHLIVSEADNGKNHDHANWVNATFTVTGKRPESFGIPRPAPYILTPKPGPEPKITGPKVFGVRPGSPFLFTVTATGSRPMKFSAKGLPAGLKLDATNGRITGKLDTKGEYAVTLAAENKLGRSERPFRIKAGDTICLTPPMGWNSWNCWAREVTDEKVRASARAMIDSGLVHHG